MALVHRAIHTLTKGKKKEREENSAASLSHTARDTKKRHLFHAESSLIVHYIEFPLGFGHFEDVGEFSSEQILFRNAM